MKVGIDNDNIYKEGAAVIARSNPDVELVILSYRQRIYYCRVADKPEEKTYAYFEGEIQPAEKATKAPTFSRIMPASNFVTKQ
jgi:hypothetical protein